MVLIVADFLKIVGDVKVNESNIMWYVEINKSIGFTALGRHKGERSFNARADEKTGSCFDERHHSHIFSEWR